MKKTPADNRLDRMLRGHKLAAGGFMGEDSRDVAEIVEADAAACRRLGTSPGEIATLMGEVTRRALEGLGAWVRIEGGLEAMVEEARGTSVCPWPHGGVCAKRVTVMRDKDLVIRARWSDLNTHMIAEHGFFEGKGSSWRLEPASIISLLKA